MLLSGQMFVTPCHKRDVDLVQACNLGLCD